MATDIMFKELLDLKWEQINIMKQIANSHVGIVLAELQVKLFELKTKEKDLMPTLELTEDQTIEVEGLELLIELYEKFTSANNEMDKIIWTKKINEVLRILSDPIKTREELSATTH
ncbi:MULTISPECIES: hypothetical protein [unclassified Paenibacillus]|uniref:hypothetical protein n=1 Tax=unclassified Paenibacillus TaxID=185978 RepID=UPI0030F8D47B